MLSIYDMFIIYFHCYMLYILSFILGLITCLFIFLSYHSLCTGLIEVILHLCLIDGSLYYGCSTEQDAFAIDIS